MEGWDAPELKSGGWEQICKERSSSAHVNKIACGALRRRLRREWERLDLAPPRLQDQEELCHLRHISLGVQRLRMVMPQVKISKKNKTKKLFLGSEGFPSPPAPLLLTFSQVNGTLKKKDPLFNSGKIKNKRRKRWNIQRRIKWKIASCALTISF